MKKIKSELPAENGSEIETVDAGRRQALARLGLTAAIAYAAPTLLPLRSASAASGGGDGGNGGNDGSSGDDSGGTSPSNSDDSGSSPSGGDDSGDDSSNDDSPTQPTEATSPSE